jgi:hypothetical protein
MAPVAVFLGAIFLFVAGCCSDHPDYAVYPTLKLDARMGGTGLVVRSCGVVRFLGLGKNTEVQNWWGKTFQRSVARMEENEWDPSQVRLTSQFDKVSSDYNVETNRKAQLVAAAMNVFSNSFKLEGADHADKGARNNIASMVRLADLEHPNLLVPLEDVRESIPVARYRLPALVSDRCPADVSLTCWTAEKSEKASSSVVTAAVIFAVNSLTNLIIKDAGGATVTVVGDASAKKDTASKHESVDDFKTEQKVTLSVSTMLNSPSVCDRIEYVSTYIWIEPYPFPPSGDVVPEAEFWRHFFSLNAARDPEIKHRAELSDMRRALEDMRVRLVDADTTVEIKDIDLGQWTRTSTQTKSASLQGTVGVLQGATLSPSVSVQDVADSRAIQTLKQQLDQRSTYVDPNGHFLRITQRGVQSVNLAGRFLETLTFRVPAANQKCFAVVPDQDAEYAVKWFSMPLYSRLDALTFSVVVARQTTQFAKDRQDTYHQTDASDAAYIAGVTSPERITLWQFARKMIPVYSDVVSSPTTNAASRRPVMFAPEGTNVVCGPLYLTGFDEHEAFKFFAKLRQATGAVSNAADGVFSFTRTNDTASVQLVFTPGEQQNAAPTVPSTEGKGQHIRAGVYSPTASEVLRAR